MASGISANDDAVYFSAALKKYLPIGGRANTG
jgi:hypothetical protein